MEQHAGFFTKILESVFNTHRKDSPVYTMRPFHEWPTMGPFDESSTLRPFDKRPTFGPFQERSTVRTFHDRPTLRPPLGPHWDSQPYDIKTESPSNAVDANASSLALSLEKILWVFLSGFGVVVLMAIFMKLGGPIRRVRRQLSHGRSAPNDETTTTLHLDDGDPDMSALLRPSADLPPPYCEVCVEEPPPRFSACFTSFTNPKDAEPQVHIRRQNDLNENGLKVQSVPMNNSKSVSPGKRTELVFDNGKVIERLS